jgi:hypothetical protein
VALCPDNPGQPQEQSLRILRGDHL